MIKKVQEKMKTLGTRGTQRSNDGDWIQMWLKSNNRIIIIII